MKKILKKYYEMNDNEKDDIEDLCILHELEEQLKNYEDLAILNIQKLFQDY